MPLAVGTRNAYNFGTLQGRHKCVLLTNRKPRLHYTDWKRYFRFVTSPNGRNLTSTIICCQEIPAKWSGKTTYLLQKHENIKTENFKSVNIQLNTTNNICKTANIIIFLTKEPPAKAFRERSVNTLASTL